MDSQLCNETSVASGHGCGSLHALPQAEGSSPFVLEFRSALSDELILDMQQQGPCKANVLQINLAAVLGDDAPPVLLRQGIPLAAGDILSEEATLLVVRRVLPDEVVLQLEMARKAVSHLKPEHLTSIKELKMPPEPLYNVLRAILLLLGNADCSWLSMKKFLGGRAATQKLLTLRPCQVSFESQLAIQQMVQQFPHSFEHKCIYRVSVAAAPFAALVLAFIACWKSCTTSP